MRESIFKIEDDHECLLRQFSALAEFACSLSQSGDRGLLLLAGEVDWGIDLAKKIFNTLLLNEILWVDCEIAGSVSGKHIPADKARHILGQEFASAVLNATASLDANVIAAVSGTVARGGLLVILWPAGLPNKHQLEFDLPFSQWRFLQRVLSFPLATRLFDQQYSVDVLSGDNAVSVFPAKNTESSSESPVSWQLSKDQQSARALIRSVAKGHANRPLLIYADRGRGKSSLLGEVAAELINEGGIRIAVTAPSKRAAQAIFSRVEANAVEAVNAPVFYAPDDLVQQRPPVHLLLVDEAAAIPQPLLKKILQQHNRVVFASTLHGYEGSGSGFVVKFSKFLDAQYPQWRRFQLHTAQRWQQNDSLEACLYDALLLNADPFDSGKLSIVPCSGDVTTEFLGRAVLANNEVLLRDVFALLVSAHYQTKPSDAFDLLDNQDLRVFVLMQSEKVVAAALVDEEVVCEATLYDDITRGKRRLVGRLLPQLLASQLGMSAALGLRYWRVRRIAVNTSVQGKNYGTQLLTEIQVHAEREAIDFLGSVFSASTQVLRFWRKNHYQIVHLGIQRNTTSGCHSAVVLKNLSAAASLVQQACLKRFVDYWPFQIQDCFQQLDDQQLQEVSRQLPMNKPVFDEQQCVDLQLFAESYRPLELSILPLRQLVLWFICQSSSAAENEPRGLMIKVILQRQPWTSVIVETGITGKSEGLALLRRHIGVALRYYLEDAETC